MKLNDLFRRMAVWVSTTVGKPWAFFLALFLIISWATTGPFFGFSNRWQLVINTGTTIVTLLMVFLIQNTQNRNSKATQIKLDELLKAIRGARNALIDLEDLPDETIDQLTKESQKLGKKYSHQLKSKRK
jgi:low affinity Fe/Cu permease